MYIWDRSSSTKKTSCFLFGGVSTGDPVFFHHFQQEEIRHPLVNIQKAIEHGPLEIVDLPIMNGGFFHGLLYVYQAG